jgi:putative ABC transport system ATP-binding protein
MRTASVTLSPPTGSPAVDLEAPPALRIEELTRQFGGRTVLDVAAWTIPAGGHCLVLGPSGCGKSTLLHLIAGLLRPSRGRILVASRELTAMYPSERDRFRGRNIGVVLQNLHLIAAISVRDNLRLARSLAGLPEDPERLARLLDELDLAGLAGRRPPQLSQGEAQRVAIARAVINRPVLVLADEPTSALDDANCAAVVRLLLQQTDSSGATLVIATHDHRLRPHFAERLRLAPAA